MEINKDLLYTQTENQCDQMVQQKVAKCSPKVAEKYQQQVLLVK